MKTIQLLFLLVPVLLMSQKNYAPLNAEWNYEGHEINCHGYHINYVVEKEEIIQGKDCSIIFAYTSSDLNQTLVKSPDSLIVWENDNKVYFLEDTTFYLLFDFNNQVGDTITYFEPINKSVFSTYQIDDSSQGPNMYQMLITEVELLNTSNMELRKYNTELVYPEGLICTEPNSIIENIGSTSQKLTGDQACYVADGCFGGLQCYHNDVIDYRTSAVFETPNPSCDILDSVSESIREAKIMVFPNPASNKITVQTDNKIDQIQLITMNGQTLETIHNKEYISIENLECGIYFLKVVFKSSFGVVKFVKE